MGEPRDPRWPRPWGSQRAWRRRRRHRARARVDRVFPRQTALHRAGGKELGERGLERDPSGVGRQRDRVLHISCLSSFCVFASTGSGAAAGAALQRNLPAWQGVGGRECPREVRRNELPSVRHSGRIFAAGRPHDAPNVACGREESGSCTQGWLGRALLHHYRWRWKRARPSQLQPTIRPHTVPSLRPSGVRVRERKKKGGAESRHETRLTHVEGRGIPPTSTGPPRLCPSHPRHPLQGAAVPSGGTLPLPRNPGSKDVQRQAEHFFRPTPSPGPPRSGLPLLNRSTQGVLVGPCCPSSHPRPWAAPRQRYPADWCRQGLPTRLFPCLASSGARVEILVREECGAEESGGWRGGGAPPQVS